MRAVVQRVSSAAVRVEGEIVGAIGKGLLVLLGVGTGDSMADVDYLAGKITGLRIFGDATGRLNLSVKEAGGEILLVSQFTLYGDCRHGRRPDFTSAAAAEVARKLYAALLEKLEAAGVRVACGRFQAYMQVELVNDGPVTVLLDSRRMF